MLSASPALWFILVMNLGLHRGITVMKKGARPIKIKWWAAVSGLVVLGVLCAIWASRPRAPLFMQVPGHKRSGCTQSQPVMSPSLSTPLHSIPLSLWFPQITRTRTQRALFRCQWGRGWNSGFPSERGRQCQLAKGKFNLPILR